MAVQTSHELDKMKDHKTGKLSGFKYKISKTDITKIMKNIQDLDKILYSQDYPQN